MRPTLSPARQAADLRAKAATAVGDDKAYLLWLAQEWEKSAQRHGDWSEPSPPPARIAAAR